jgi:hypothetical protein
MTMRAEETALSRAAATLDRRSFLRLLAVAGAAGLLPAGCGSVPPALLPREPDGLAVLSPRSYATFTAAASRIVGPAGSELIAARSVDVGAAADAWLARTPELAAPIIQALLALEFGVWPLVDKLVPFTRLDDAARDRVLAGLMLSRFELKQAVFQGVRSLALLTFYSAAASRALTGYPGPFGNARVSIASAMS